MSYSDKNKIFFGLLHYIFSEQPNVNWALKTSLVNFTGINETINQKKYKNDSISNDIIKYVKEVKPYHVQYDHYIEKYSTKTDECNVSVSDTFKPTIKVRYDNVSPTPNIKDSVYTFAYDESQLKLKQSENIKYINTQDWSVYTLKKDKKNNYYWKYTSHVGLDDIFYIEDIDKVYIVKEIYYENLKQYIKELVDINNYPDDKERFENESMANRLFLYKTKDLELIKEYTNSHFKGITINGGNFNLDRSGYDAFLYDLYRYEEPTKTAGYCLVDTSKTQIPVGTNTFVIDYEGTIEKNNLTITSNLHTDEIKDYLLNNNRITLFYNTQKDEQITIRYLTNTFIFITNSFDESSDESYTRTFIDVNSINENGDYILDIPYSPIKINKVSVSIEKPNGYRYPTQNYDLIDNKVYIHDFANISNRINWKIYISIADYSLIYDKIYTWEDTYGVSNNKALWENYYKNHGLIQNVTGNDFLNPYYEKNRPDELSVIYPENTLMIYFSKKNETKTNFKARKIFNFNYKNEQKFITTPKTALLLSDFNIGDTEIYINKDIFSKPYKDPNYPDKLIPGKILINSEIIEFYDYILNEDNSIILKKIRRGSDGTYINSLIKENTIVYPFENINKHDYYLTPSYYYIKNSDMTEFDINGNTSIHEDRINVYKTKRISLLTEINSSSTSFTISDNSIFLPHTDINGNFIKGYLYINNDKILFDNISKNTNGTYTISGFNLPLDKVYYPNDSQTIIPSNKFIKLKDNEYTINTERHEELKHLDSSRNRNYITLNTQVKIGECIIIENYNYNVFD